MKGQEGPPKPRLGRPPLPAGQAKKVFTIRLTGAERDAVDAAATDAGKPVRQWAREVLVAAAGS